MPKVIKKFLYIIILVVLAGGIGFLFIQKTIIDNNKIKQQNEIHKTAEEGSAIEEKKSESTVDEKNFKPSEEIVDDDEDDDSKEVKEKKKEVDEESDDSTEIKDKEKEEVIDLNIITADDMILGSDKAPIDLIIYDSITCHHCATFNLKTFDKIRENYVNKGKVRIILREFPLDIIAFKVTTMMKCFEKDFDLHRRLRLALFQSQRKWIFQRTDHKRLEVVKNILSFANIEKEKLDQCMDSKGNSDLVLKDRKNAILNGLNGTPIFVINGQIFEGLEPYSFFDSYFQEILKENN